MAHLTADNAGLDPDLSARGSPAQAGEFDEDERPRLRRGFDGQANPA